MNRRYHGLWGLVLLSCIFLPLLESRAAEIRLGVPVPEKSRECQLLRDQAERIKTQTQGRIDILLRFMKEDQMMAGEMVKNGELDGCLAIEPDFPFLGLGQQSRVYAIPFLFSGSDDVEALRSTLDPLLLESMDNDDVKAVDFVDLGFMYFCSANSLATSDEWKNQLFWLPAADLLVTRLLKATELRFSNIAFKRVLNSLENGEIQGVLSPLPLVIMKRWHTRLKFVYRSPVVYSYGIWAIDRRLIDRFDTAEREAFSTALRELGKTLEKAGQQRYESSVKVLDRYGIVFIEPTSALSARWQEWLQGWLPEVQQELNLSVPVMRRLTEYIESRKETEHE
ncbi:MAG: hypothetical protein CSA26_07195 [Desulfobacterales bacterium]|nr:MAG: hypothetical protein CSA26_07195 [Desulfobacterales bacterium]